MLLYTPFSKYQKLETEAADKEKNTNETLAEQLRKTRELEQAREEDRRMIEFEINQRDIYQKETFELRDENASLKLQLTELTRESNQLKPQYQRELIERWRTMLTGVERKFNSG